MITAVVCHVQGNSVLVVKTRHVNQDGSGLHVNLVLLSNQVYAGVLPHHQSSLHKRGGKENSMAVQELIILTDFCHQPVSFLFALGARISRETYSYKCCCGTTSGHNLSQRLPARHNLNHPIKSWNVELLVSYFYNGSSLGSYCKRNPNNA
jgi:hypothetical protein